MYNNTIIAGAKTPKIITKNIFGLIILRRSPGRLVNVIVY
jgi:hypothetical protein